MPYIGTAYRIKSCVNESRTFEIRWVGDEPLLEDKIYGLDVNGIRSCWYVDFIPESAYDNESEEFGNLPIFSDNNKYDDFDTCEECHKIFYRFIDCETGENFLYDGSLLYIDDESFQSYLDKSIKIDIEGTEYCLAVTSILALGLTAASPEYTVNGCFRTCEDCQAPPPVEDPEPEYEIKKKNYEPNFGLPICSLEEYTRIHSKFSESMYKQMVEVKYGLEICNEIDEEKYLIDKALLDLQIIDNSFSCCDDNGLWDPCVEDGGIGFMTINGDDCNPFTIHPST